MPENGWRAAYLLLRLLIAIQVGLPYPSLMRDRSFLKRFALGIYVICFSIGVLTHTLDFVQLGPRPYAWAPLPFEVFWSSLVILDALVIVILLTGFLKVGLSLSAMIMIVDVLVNFYTLIVLENDGFAFAVPLQALFLGFVLGSIGFLWPRSETSALQ